MITLPTIIDHPVFRFFFFFNDTATTEIYTLSLHDALPISMSTAGTSTPSGRQRAFDRIARGALANSSISRLRYRSEEHTSELQSQSNIVCRLLLEKKNHRFHYRTSRQAGVTRCRPAQTYPG